MHIRINCTVQLQITRRYTRKFNKPVVTLCRSGFRVLVILGFLPRLPIREELRLVNCVCHWNYEINIWEYNEGLIVDYIKAVRIQCLIWFGSRISFIGATFEARLRQGTNVKDALQQIALPCSKSSDHKRHRSWGKSSPVQCHLSHN